MRLSFRAGAVAVAAALVLPFGGAAARAVGVSGVSPTAAVPGPARVNASFAATLAEATPTTTVGGFVHYRDAAGRVEHEAVLRRHGLTLSTEFDGAAASFAYGPAAGFRTLRHEPTVSFLEGDLGLRLDDATDGYATRADAARKEILGGPFRDAAGNVLTGAGVGVAVIDSGIYGTHPDFGDRVKANFKVVCETPMLVNSAGEKADQCFQVTFVPAEDTDTSGGHGTHVAGIVAGDGSASDGTLVGAAPGAALYGFSVGEGISIDTLQAASAFQWIIENHDRVSPPIKVINNSWGCTSGCAFDPESIITKQADRSVAEGITITWSHGNNGSDGDDGSADNSGGHNKNPTPGIIAVANYDDAGSGDRDNTLDTSSSRGKLGDPTTYPDVAAPGSLITATCKPNAPVCGTGPDPQWQPYYATISGTSMAAPHVAGTVALLLQADPTLTPADVEDLLKDTAHRFDGGASAPGDYESDPRNSGGLTSYDKGAGLVDLPAALAALGVVGDGHQALGRIPFRIETPQLGCRPALDGACPAPVAVDGPTVVSGYANTSTRSAANDLIKNDAGDYEGFGAADIDSLRVTELANDIQYRIGVRDVTDEDPNGVLLRVNQNVNGVAAWTNVDLFEGVATPTAYNATSNQAPATSATVDTATNTVTVTVPKSAYRNGTAASMAHNTVVTSLTSVIQDVAPGGLGASYLTNPVYADEWGFNIPGDGSGARVEVQVDRDAPVSVTPVDDRWETTIDFSALSPGVHTVTARLFVDGIPRRKENSIQVTVADEGGPDVIPPSVPIFTAPANGAVTGVSATFKGTGEPGTYVVLREGTKNVKSGPVKADGTWTITAAFTGGSHSVVARGFDTALNQSADSAPLTFTVDATPPTVAIGSETSTTYVLAQPTWIRGTANDAYGILAIRVKLTDTATNRVYDVLATCNGCGGTGPVTWEARPKLPAGTYTVVATAYDGNKNPGYSNQIQIVRAGVTG